MSIKITENQEVCKMPIYEILCNYCDKTNELMLFKESDILECPSCGSKDVKKLMSTSNNVVNNNSSKNTFGSCCGRNSEQSDCEEPGSCCGRTI